MIIRKWHISQKLHCRHFNKTGKIFSFSYGQKYEKNDHGYSIGKYADKTNREKNTSAEKQQMVRIEQIIERQMVVGIKNISKKLSLIPSITSPEIGTLQHCLYLHQKNDKIKHNLP